MAELVAVAFDGPGIADDALSELRRLQREYLIDLEDAVVAVRRPDGQVDLKQSVNLMVLRSSLSPEQEARLQAVLTSAASPPRAPEASDVRREAI